MATATKNKTNRLLREVLQEVREVRALVEPISHAYRSSRATRGTVKKLPKGVMEGLRDIKAGRVSGPFNTVEELMADLRR